MASNKGRRKEASVRPSSDGEDRTPADLLHTQADSSEDREEVAASALATGNGELMRSGEVANSANQSAIIDDGKESRTNMRINAAIGANIRRLRVGLNLSQENLARAAGITAGHLGEIERGSTGPGSITLARLAFALGVPLSPIFPERHELAHMLDLEDDSRKPDVPDEDTPASLVSHADLTNGSAVVGLHVAGSRVADYVPAIELPDGWAIDPDGNAFGWKGRTRVELLLSGSRVAEVLQIKDRTLQKWVAHHLLIPSCYVVQGRLGGSTGDMPRNPRLTAAFRLSDLPDAIELRAGARVRKQGYKRSAKRKRESD